MLRGTRKLERDDSRLTPAGPPVEPHPVRSVHLVANCISFTSSNESRLATAIKYEFYSCGMPSVRLPSTSDLQHVSSCRLPRKHLFLTVLLDYLLMYDGPKS